MPHREPWRNRIIGSGEEAPDQLLANPANFRIHPKPQQDALSGALNELGWIQQVIVNRTTGHVVDGHLRVSLAISAREPMVPVLYVDLSPEEEALALLTLDPIAAMAAADKAQLDALLREVQTGDAGIQAMLADLAEREGLAYGKEEVAEDPGAQIDRAEELREKWGTERGQLWEIGKHRLMCGDSTNAGAVARLMGGEKADAVLTDPPYGQNQPGVSEDEPEKLRGIVRGAVAVLPCENAIIVAFQSPRTFPEWLDAARQAGYRFERMLWLYKAAQCTFPWRGWILKSESILVFTVGEGQWQEVHPFAHDCYYLPEVSGELAKDAGWHGSVKPLSVVSDLMRRICPEGGRVFDGFLGSGTTMVAAEQLGRVCYGMEISPAYVAVAIERLSGMGLEPTLVE